MAERALLRRIGVWFASVRVLALPFAVVQVAATDFPPGYRAWAWVTTAVLGAGGVVLLVGSRADLTESQRRRVAEVALVFDTAVVYAFVFVYAFLEGQPAFSLFFVPVLEAALRFGVVGGIGMTVATSPVLAAAEVFRADRFDPMQVRAEGIAIRVLIGLLLGALVGRLVTLLFEQMRTAAARAEEAEQLRDALGRRVDVLEASNRCARALGSSLRLERAFGAFIRELRGLVPFDRTAIVLAEDDSAQVMATAGLGADEVFPPGTAAPVAGTVLEEVLHGQLVVQDDLRQGRFAADATLADLGLRSELSAPLLLGPRAVGMLTISRAELASFTAEEIELVSLLGRLVATAVQNIRAYEAERSTVEELRRLSTLRADFVSLVSHELRSPMAAVIGAARTLQQRWRELGPEQRESFLALIADETGRLAALIGDVLDTSRIEAGTFSYTFEDVDLGALAREAAATAGLAQDEVQVDATVREPVPPIRGDADRLRQVLRNLIDNAVKFSPSGAAVNVTVYAHGDTVLVDVSDNGPGIARDQQLLIFEKFGRARAGHAKPGTGLGLFIARSIAEAHGGTIDVRSAPERGSTFTLALPAAA